MTKLTLNFESQGTEKIKLFSQGTYNFPVLGNETPVDDFKYAKIFKFASLDLTF